MRHEPQVHKVAPLEKRSPMIKAKENDDCGKASYRTMTLYDFVYKHGCFPPGWEGFLSLVHDEIQTNLSPKLFKEGQMRRIEPSMPEMFKAFTVSLNNVRAVILGQDPTPQADKATGLAFSLKPGEDPREVPSVFNMLVELRWEGMDVGLSNGDLTPWVYEGVLLLNAALTVPRGTVQVQAGSHQKLWTTFTEILVQYINEKSSHSAWLLWGAEAKNFQNLITRPKHMIKAGAHPRVTTGFYGRNYFRCANEFLGKHGRGQIKWKLQEVQESFAKYVEGCDAEGLQE